MAPDSRGQLDHSQQMKKRVAPVPPTWLWERFLTVRTVKQMIEAIERMMEGPPGRTLWEMKEAEEEYEMRFAMPGMGKDDVKVWVEERMLVVKAEKEIHGGEEERSGKSYGRYSSRIALPENVVVEKITAEVKDGVLYITFAKAAASSARVFNIHVQ